MSDQVGPIFFALSDPTRRRVVERLARGEAMTATELASELPITRQAVSKHLSALSEAGLVETERVGRELRFALKPRPMHDAVSWIAEIGAEWDERLAALKDHLARPQAR